MAYVVTTPDAAYGFICNAVGDDISGCEEILAAVAGKKIIVKHVTINSGANITITLGAGETGGNVTTALLGPITFAANTSMVWNFSPYMYLPTATSLTCDSSGAGNICIFVQGVIQ